VSVLVVVFPALIVGKLDGAEVIPEDFAFQQMAGSNSITNGENLAVGTRDDPGTWVPHPQPG
jgi:hypothetical protein